MKRIEQEFAQYLKGKKGFQRLVTQWIVQYQKLGYIGGTIAILKASVQEKEAIGGFMGKDYRQDRDIKIRYSSWMKAVDASRFEGCDFFEVLLLCHGKAIQTKSEKKLNTIEKEQANFDALFELYKGSKAYEWLKFVCREKNKSYAKMKAMFLDGTQGDLHCTLRAVNALPFWKNEAMLIAVFSTQISGNPHFFDKGNPAHLLYESMLYFMDRKQVDPTLEERHQTYYDAGLLRDDLSNYCMLCHINAYIQDTIVHPAWNGFYERYEPWIVNQYNVQQIVAIHDTIHKVYIVENPSIFRSLCVIAKQRNLQHIGLMCGNGQLNLCAFRLLDFMAKSAIPMYYAGDFDPEGLLIADKLKRKYGDLLILWRYTIEAYHHSMSKEIADDRRLFMLEKCECEEVQDVKQCMLHEKRCGYQEALLQHYLKDLENDG